MQNLREYCEHSEDGVAEGYQEHAQVYQQQALSNSEPFECFELEASHHCLLQRKVHRPRLYVFAI